MAADRLKIILAAFIVLRALGMVGFMTVENLPLPKETHPCGWVSFFLSVYQDADGLSRLNQPPGSSIARPMVPAGKTEMTVKTLGMPKWSAM